MIGFPPQRMPIGVPQQFLPAHSRAGEVGSKSLCGPSQPKSFSSSLFFCLYCMNRWLSGLPLCFSRWRPLLIEGPEDLLRGGDDVIQVYEFRAGVNAGHLMTGNFFVNRGVDTRDMMNRFPLNLVHLEYIPTTSGLSEREAQCVRNYTREMLIRLRARWPNALIFSANSMAFCSEFVKVYEKPASTFWAVGENNARLGQSIFGNYLKFEEMTAGAIERFGCTSRNSFDQLHRERAAEM